MEQHLLQRVVMPHAKDKAYRELFMRSDEVECNAFSISLNVLEEMYFNTWMNLFAAKKWFHYTQISELYLGLDISGTFCVEIIGSNRNAAYNRIDESLYFKEYLNIKEPVFIHVSNPANYDAVYFILRYQKKHPCIIQSMGWYTDAKPLNRNCLAIVTCTYKRENFVLKTIKNFELYMKEHEELYDRMHLFVVDNGQTLDMDLKSNYTDIYANRNAGGAGGFGRGLIEVCRAKKGYTRCLFMDDDVEIIPESFYRTLVLADYLKEEYADALINGAMFDMYNKKMFIENLAVQDGLWVHPYYGETDAYEYDEILKINHIPDDIYTKEYPKINAAWFYCSFKIDKTYINQLPMPFFIRGDDVEYGYRNHGKVFIQLNGICIWHAPFFYRVNKVTDTYYLYRNMFIVNVLYTEGFKQQFAAYFKMKFRYAIATYDYVSARLLIKAMEDILKGSRMFDENPEHIMDRLNELAKEDDNLCTDLRELTQIRDRKFEWSKLRHVINRMIRICYRVIPYSKCVIKRDGMNTAPEWMPPADAFLIQKHVKVYNLLKHTSIVRTFDYQQEKVLTKSFNSKMKQLTAQYESLEKDYNDNFSRLTSYEFWTAYLGIK